MTKPLLNPLKAKWNRLLNILLFSANEYEHYNHVHSYFFVQHQVKEFCAVSRRKISQAWEKKNLNVIFRGNLKLFLKVLKFKLFISNLLLLFSIFAVLRVRGTDTLAQQFYKSCIVIVNRKEWDDMHFQNHRDKGWGCGYHQLLLKFLGLCEDIWHW